jgi:CelD/BcsL family acetyltransferase involved in cellulose biosynthesis
VHEWLRAYGDEGEIAIHLARQDGRLVGALPLFVRRRKGLRVVAFVGEHASALGDLLLRGDADPEVGRALVAQAAAGGHDIADLFGLPQGSLLGRAAGDRLRLIERVEAPVLDLAGGWEAVYAAKTGSKKRNLHRRRRRQLAELGETLEVVRARTPEELRPALEDAFRLHDLRWEGRPDGSGFTTAKGIAFNRAALERLAEQDVPRIVTLKLDGRAIAFHYYFAVANRMYVYRLAFDPELSRFSPGLVNTLDALEWAGDEGLERVEYLGGDERYKLELSDRLEPLYQGLGLAGTPQGRAVVRLRLGSIRARRRLKRSPALHKLYFEGLAPVRRLADRLRSARS